MSTAIWKLEKDLCRCCHAEGSFKNLSEPCFQLGQEEIYYDMLTECLDIKIIPMTGELSAMTYTICESCIVRLRDASNFKRQVLDCEERFKDMYSRNLIRGYEVKVEPALSDNEDMKHEFQSVDEDDDDAFIKFDDEANDSELTVPAIAEKPKAKSKTKSKSKAKAKPPAKKRVKKSIKKEETEMTEAAVSGEKKKGRQPKENLDAKDNLICNVTLEEDGTKTFTCCVCSHSFKQRQYFRLHYKHVHLKQRPKTRPCTICGAQLTPHKHARHLEQAHGKPAPSCGACGKKFSFPFEVIKHQKTFHMGEKHFQCEKCSMTFSHKKNLNLHVLKHQDVKNFKCKLCGKAFKWRNNLTEHEKTHVKIKKHVCAICEAAFVKHRSLQHHVKLRHPEAI